MARICGQSWWQRYPSWIDFRLWRMQHTFKVQKVFKGLNICCNVTPHNSIQKESDRKERKKEVLILFRVHSIILSKKYKVYVKKISVYFRLDYILISAPQLRKLQYCLKRPSNHCTLNSSCHIILCSPLLGFNWLLSWIGNIPLDKIFRWQLLKLCAILI